MALRQISSSPHPAPVELYEPGLPSETTAQRIARLQTEARLLAREEVEQMVRDFNALAARAAAVAEGGDAYPAGVREMASRIADDLPHKATSLTAILDRSLLT